MPSFNYITPSYGEAESAHGLRSNLSSDRPSNGTMPFNVDRFTPFVPSGNRPAFNLDRPQRATTWTNPSSNFTNFSVTRPRGSLMNPAVPDFVPHGRGLDSRPVPDIDRTQRVTPWTNVSSSNATNSIHHSTSHIASNTNVSNIDPTPMGHGLVSRPVLNIDRSQRVSPWNYISSSNTSTNSIHHNTSHITSNINVSHTNPAPNNSQNGSSHRPYNAVDTFRSLYVRERARFNAELADIQRPVTTLPSPAPASSLDSRPVLNIDGSERAAPERAAPERAAPEQAAPPTNLAQSSSAHSLDINRSERASLTNLTQSSSAPSLDINRSEQAAPPTNLFHSSSAPSLDINRSERAAPPTNLFQSSSAPTSFSNPPLNSRLVLTIDRSQRVTPWSNLSSSNGLAHSTDYGTSRAPKSNNIPRINSTLSAPTSSTPAQLTSSIAGQKRRLELSEGEEERPSIPFSLQATPYSLTMASAKIPTTPEIRPPGRWPGGTPITPRLVDRQNSRQEGPSRMTAIRNMWQNRLMRVANNRMIQRASQAARWAAHRNVLQNRMTRAVYNGVIQHAPQAARRAVHVVDTFKRRVQQIFQRPARIRNETPVEQVRAAINIWANPDTDLAVGNEIIRPEPMDIDSAVENVTVINETMDVGTEAVSNEVTNTDSGIVNDSAIVNNSATASKKRAAPDSDEAVSPPKRTKASSRRVQGALKTQSKGEKRRAEQIRPLKSALRRPSGASSKPKQAADDEVDQGTSKPPRRVHFPRCHEVTAEHILTPINEAPRRYRNLSYDDRYDAAPPSLDHLLDDFGRSMVESVKSASPKVCLVEQKENKAPASEATISNQLRRSARIRNGNAKAENSSSANQGASAMTPRDRHGQDPFRREAEQYPMGRAMSAVSLFHPIPPLIPAGRTESLFAERWRAIQEENQKISQQEISQQVKSQQAKSQGGESRHPESLKLRNVARRKNATLPLNITKEWVQRLEEVMAGPPSKKIISTLSGETLTARDLATCYTPLEWLNDEVINAYLALIIDYMRRTNNNSGRNDRPRFHAFNSFFFSNLRDKGYDSVRRWATRAKIGGEALLSVDTVFVPIHDKSHWTLIVLKPCDRTIEHFDSLGGLNKRHVDLIKMWLRGELGGKFVEEDWEVLPSLSPRQDNGSDCGVFLLSTAKAVAINLEPQSYGAPDSPLLRRKIVVELMNGGLDGDFVPTEVPGYEYREVPIQGRGVKL